MWVKVKGQKCINGVSGYKAVKLMEGSLGWTRFGLSEKLDELSLSKKWHGKFLIIFKHRP